MVKRSKLNLIFLIMSVIMAAMSLSVSSGADLFGNGLSASRTTLALGETFTLYINIPSETQLLERHDADSLNFKVYYDSDALEILSYPDSLDFLNVPSQYIHIKESYCGDDAGGSFFSFAASSTACNIPTKNGMRLSATFRVRTDTKKPYVNFSLTDHVLGYTDETQDPVAVVDMWRNVVTPDLQIAIPENVIPETATWGGIELSSPTAYTGSIFTADIKIPSISKIIDTAQITLTYRSDLFELLSVSEGKSGLSVSTDKYSGIISFYAQNGQVDLRNGAVLTAKFKVNQDTPPDDYLFRLSRTELVYRGNSLWNPQYITDELTVLDSTEAFPGFGGGIYLSSDYTSSGTNFDLYIKVPATDFSADNINIRVEYSDKAFELLSWDLPSPRISVSYGNGYVDFTSSGYDIDLRYGLVIKANMHTRYNTTSGKYSFRLVNKSITSSNIDYMLWSPTNTISYINVTSEIAVTTRDPYVTMDSREFTTTSSPLPYATVSNADTTRPVNTTTSSNNHYYNDDDDNDGVYDPDDPEDPDDYYRPDDGVYDPDDSDYDTTLPAGSSVNIYIDPNISGVNNQKVSALTKTEFFNGNIIIFLRNTSEAESSAKTALNSLGLTSARSYAFDISVYNDRTGKYIHNIRNGFIDFKIPLPSIFSGYTGSIDVYHIADGEPRYIDSSIVTENGVQKIYFRADSFSPYMLVMKTSSGGKDTTIYIPGNTGNTNNSNNTSNSADTKGSPDTPTTGRTGNPHTGYVLAAVIPAAAAGCVILARKEKRKRCSKR